MILMAKFSYLARDHGGAAHSGEVVAASTFDAVQLLRAEGKTVVRLKETSAATESVIAISQQGRRRIKSDDVIYFATQLAGMVEAGVSLAEALEATIDKAPPSAFRRIIEDVIAKVQGGVELSAALAAHPKVFTPIFIHMVRASEATGTLGAMLGRVADYLTNQQELRKKIKGALTYPCAMVVLAFGAVIFVLTFVLPKFAAIYAGKQAVLPLPTRILMATSHAVVSNWYYLLSGAALLAAGIWIFSRTDRGRYTIDWLRLNMPILGSIFRKACVTRTLQTLGSMISAGVSVLEAVPITRDVVGNRLFARIFNEACKRMESGEQLSQALQNAPYIPRNVWQIMRAGERTGKVGPTLNRVAELCDADLKNSIRVATQFIEPAMIMVLGALIGGMSLAVLLPIFQISKVIAH